MPSLFAPLTDRDPAAAAPSEREIVPGRFAAAAEAGQTIALVMAKDPDAAVVYYFREAARALSTYERLARMGSTPAVAYISPAGAVLGPAQLALTPSSAAALPAGSPRRCARIPRPSAAVRPRARRWHAPGSHSLRAASARGSRGSGPRGMLR